MRRARLAARVFHRIPFEKSTADEFLLIGIHSHYVSSKRVEAILSPPYGFHGRSFVFRHPDFA
jgi:hypothetical protein